VASIPTRLITFAEFERLPDPPAGIRYELHHGELISVPPPRWKHAKSQERLRSLLAACAGGSGIVWVEMPFRATLIDEFRQADVACLASERAVQVDKYLIGAPDLVIEILSRSNSASEMLDREKLCLENGSREFWVVDLERQQVKVSTPDRHTLTYISGDEIPLFFGGKLAVDTIFE
jgi:Uma2 family endonuclease